MISVQNFVIFFALLWFVDVDATGTLMTAANFSAWKCTRTCENNASGKVRFVANAVCNGINSNLNGACEQAKLQLSEGGYQPTVAGICRSFGIAVKCFTASKSKHEVLVYEVVNDSDDHNPVECGKYIFSTISPSSNNDG